MTTRGHIAAIRFGYGLRQGEAPPADPMAWLEAQIASPGPPAEGVAVSEAIRLRAEFLAERRRLQMSQQAEQQAQAAQPAPATPPADAARAAQPLPDPTGEIRRADARSWAERRLTTPEGFRERLVDFWLNHFTVSRRHGAAGVLIGPLEREAIRPHLTGRFPDMVVAVTRHPAMLVYLDNHVSIGPGSRAGGRGRRGLNENLAREVLELHTLSPAGGYTQGDVQELAKILTGWSAAMNVAPYDFIWRPEAHEPGEKRLLGRTFEAGPNSQAAALRFIATRPASYRHIAVKLTRHFINDNPPPEAIREVEGALNRNRGELAAAYRALIALPQAWDPPLTKVRTPTDYVLAAARAVGFDRPDPVLGAMGGLGQPLWTAPQPNGWADVAEAWAAPEALMRRIDWAYTFSSRFGGADPAAVAETALGPLARAETVAAMRGAGSVRDALTLLFGSPEFMHR
jgi:uncharacterized protein (DUF1800 family)